ncbi:hypothetical protein CHC10_03926 [Klebsiella pneumoniae]|nr:hypothetical protein CHC10_03926 [Klebsiella pneumoniae]
MNTAELETLIRTILSEKLAPTPPAPQQEQGIFCDVGSAIDAAHQAFLRYQQCPLKTRSAIISALRETLAPSWRRWRKRAPRKPAWATKKINI